jgi:hypothetical protein
MTIAGIQRYHTKQLLQDLERSGIPRQEFDLLGLCNTAEQIYGFPGSDLRRQVQKRFCHIKKKSVYNYVKYLESFQVLPGRATREELTMKNVSSMTPPSFKKDDDYNYRDDEEEEESGESEEEEEEREEALSYETPPPARKTNSSPYKQKLASSSSRHSKTRSKNKQQQQQHVFGAASSLRSSLAGSTSSAPFSWSSYQNGTQKNPWIIMVDIEYPERNREFDIQFVENMKRGKYERNGFHIRVTVAALDFKKYSATLPPQSQYPAEYKKRIIIVKGPSHNAWYKNYKLYHAAGNKVNCTSTAKSHKQTTLKIGKDLERQEVYWLLVFPSCIQLANQVFSDDEFVVPIGKNALINLAAENISKQDLRQLTLFWKIAVEGGEQVDTDDEGSDAEKIFAT